MFPSSKASAPSAKARTNLPAKLRATSTRAQESGRPKHTGQVAAPKKKPQPHAAAGNGATVPDPLRRDYIEVAAYYIAERRGFSGGSELEDWIEAEQQVDRMLRQHQLSL